MKPEKHTPRARQGAGGVPAGEGVHPLVPNIKLLRRCLGLPQQGMAELLGISVYSLRALEHGFVPRLLQGPAPCAAKARADAAKPALPRLPLQQRAFVSPAAEGLC